MKIKSGENYTHGKFTSFCTSCDKRKPIHYVFYIKVFNRMLARECEDCMVEHFQEVLVAKSRKEVMQNYYERQKKKGIIQIKFCASQEFKDLLRNYQKKRGFNSLYETIKYLYKMGAK